MSNVNIQRVTATLAIIAAIAMAGCTDKAAPPTGTAAENDPRAKVLGVESVGTAQETPGTTSTAKSDISKAQQGNAMPLPGQANDHSTLSPKATQKATPTK
jgi:hypothetical protein